MSSKTLRLNRRELHVLARDLLELVALLLGDRLAPAAGQARHRVYAAPAHHLDHVMVAHAAVDDLLADLQPDLVHHAQDVALGRRRVGADNEVRTAQRVEVRGVVGDVEGRVEHLAHLLGRRRRLDVKQRVQRLGGRHVVRLGADAADAVGDARHLLGRPADAELLEAAQLRDLEVGVRDVALSFEEDLDLAVTFEARDGINGDLLHRAAPFSALAPVGRARAAASAPC